MVVDMCREAALRYEYDIYHIEMVNFMNNDFCLAGTFGIVPLGFHQGDLELTNTCIDKQLSGLKRVCNEPDKAAEALGLVLGVMGDFGLYTWILGRGDDVLALLKDVGCECAIHYWL